MPPKYRFGSDFSGVYGGGIGAEDADEVSEDPDEGLPEDMEYGAPYEGSQDDGGGGGASPPPGPAAAPSTASNTAPRPSFDDNLAPAASGQSAAVKAALPTFPAKVFTSAPVPAKPAPVNAATQNALSFLPSAPAQSLGASVAATASVMPPRPMPRPAFRTIPNANPKPAAKRPVPMPRFVKR